MRRLRASVSVRFVEMQTSEEYIAWRAALQLLADLAGKREDASGVSIQPTAYSTTRAPITLADTGTDGVENWTVTEYNENENLCVFEPESIPARAG